MQKFAAKLTPALAGCLALVLLVALAAPLAAPPAAAQEQAQTRLLVNLTSDDVWTNQMAFGFANKVMDAGYEVVLFLNVRAVRVAHRDVPQPVEGMRGKTAREELEALVARGARVFVCPSCTAQAGMTPDDWIDGVEAGGPELIALQMDPLTRTISY